MKVALVKRDITLDILGNTANEMLHHAVNETSAHVRELTAQSLAELTKAVEASDELMGHSADGGRWCANIDSLDVDEWLAVAKERLLTKHCQRMQERADTIADVTQKDKDITGKLSVKHDVELHERATNTLVALRTDFCEALLLKLIEGDADDKIKKTKAHAINKSIKPPAKWEDIGEPVRKAAAKLMRKAV